jgi:hypothetical protein
LAAGLNDHELIQRLQIPNRTYYRYKNELADKIEYFQSQIMNRDISLANEVYTQRILKLYSIALTKAQDKDCKDPEFLTTAAQLATNLLVMSKNGLVAATSKRANYTRQKQEVERQQRNEEPYNTVF